MSVRLGVAKKQDPGIYAGSCYPASRQAFGGPAGQVYPSAPPTERTDVEPESTDIPFGLIEWPLIDSRLHERERIVLTMMRALNHQYPGTTSSETDLANYMGYSRPSFGSPSHASSSEGTSGAALH